MSECIAGRSTIYSRCKVCLLSDVRMYYIRNSKLVETYERLTCTKFNAEDGKPETICYLCHSQLRKSQKFSDMAQNSQKILDDLCQGVKTNQIDAKPSWVTTHNLSVSPVNTLYFLDDRIDLSAQGNEERPIVKDEINEKDIKVEIKFDLVEQMTDSKVKVEKMSDDEELVEIEIDNAQFLDHSKSTDSKTYYCDECNQKFDQKIKLAEHLVSHLNDLNNKKKSYHIENFEKFPCSVCSKIFSRKQHLNAHMRIHIGEKPFSCELCNMAFYDRKSMERHMRTHTGEKPYACETCEKTFSQAGSLQKHTRTHTGEKPFTCTMCIKTFADKSSLQSHFRVHTGEKPFACKLCNKTYSQGTTLRVHMRSHTGERPYVCNYCNKTFAKNSNYVRHMRSHTGDMPYSCTICHKTFTSNYYLQNHMRIHTGEKPYVCSVCSKRFTQKSNLYGHMKIHTGEKEFACPKCPKTFYHKNNMNKHLKKHVDSMDES